MSKRKSKAGKTHQGHNPNGGWASQAQRRFMWSQHPEIAKDIESEVHEGKGLPDHVGMPKTTTKQKHGLR